MEYYILTLSPLPWLLSGTLWRTIWSTNPACTLSADIVTKRKVVKRVLSLYDPHGFLVPMDVKGKIFIQMLWKEDLAWDQLLSEQQYQTWNDIEKQLTKATEIHIP